MLLLNRLSEIFTAVNFTKINPNTSFFFLFETLASKVFYIYLISGKMPVDLIPENNYKQTAKNSLYTIRAKIYTAR